MAMGQATKLTLRIEADGADAEELDVMTGQLLAEVRAARPDGRLLADDQWCTGRDRQTTSPYAANLMACGPNSRTSRGGCK